MKWVAESPNFDKSKWSGSADAQDEQGNMHIYNILNKLPVFREERDRFVCALALCSSKVSRKW